MLNIVVSGPRTWKGDWLHTYLRSEFLELIKEYDIRKGERVIVHEGEADGFDQTVKSIVQGFGWEVREYPIKSWYTDNAEYNPLAGHQRNEDMILASHADVGIVGVLKCEKRACQLKAEHMTHGSADGLKRMTNHGIEVRLVNPFDIKTP